MTFPTLDELKAYVGEPTHDQRSDDILAEVLAAAVEDVQEFCQRTFTREPVDEMTGDPVPSERTFKVTADDVRIGYVLIDDFYTLNDLTIDGWTLGTDYTAGPLPTAMRPGWPYYRIESSKLTTGTLTVTAHWGWVAVPAKVREVTLEHAAEMFKRKDAPFGVLGLDQMTGAVRISSSDTRLLDRLRRYRLHQALVA